MAYLIFYSLVFFIFLLSKRWKNDVIYLMLCFIVISFSAFRYETGFDWPIYDRYLNNQLPIVYFPVFEIFKYIYIYSNADKVYFYFFISIIGNAFVLSAASKYFKSYRFIFVVFYVLWTDFYLIHSFSILRQFICLGFILYAFNRWIDARSYWFFLCLAMLTHHSSFIFLFFVFSFFWIKNLKSSHVWFVFAIFSLLFLADVSIVKLLAKIVVSVYDVHYLEMYTKDNFNASIPLKIVVILSFAFILYFTFEVFKMKLISMNEYYFCLLYIFISVVFYSFPTLTTRVGLFFIFPIIKVILIYVNRVIFIQRIIVLFWMVTILTYSNYRFYSSELNVTYYPYQTWLINDDVENSTGMERTQEVYDQLDKLGVF
ncbi:EpsG family protein [Vibrio vulnificus]|uniref:EpsG family protein n=1 Tax=Vibrio vulnificus TaxID=672 RepID=UPI0040588A7B